MELDFNLILCGVMCNQCIYFFGQNYLASEKEKKEKNRRESNDKICKSLIYGEIKFKFR